VEYLALVGKSRCPVFKVTLDGAVRALKVGARHASAEQAIGSTVSHAAFVRTYPPIFTTPDKQHHAVAFELVEGVDCVRFAALADGRWKPGHVAELICQVCEALVAAGAKGFVHKDLKPDHLPVDAQGRVRILDLENARADHGDAGVTTTGVRSEATFPYGAPEPHRGPPADIYSLGFVGIQAYHQHEYRLGSKSKDFANWLGLVVGELRTTSTDPVGQALARMVEFSEDKRPTAEELLDELGPHRESFADLAKEIVPGAWAARIKELQPKFPRELKLKDIGAPASPTTPRQPKPLGAEPAPAATPTAAVAATPDPVPWRMLAAVALVGVLVLGVVGLAAVGAWFSKEEPPVEVNVVSEGGQGGQGGEAAGGEGGSGEGGQAAGGTATGGSATGGSAKVDLGGAGTSSGGRSSGGSTGGSKVKPVEPDKEQQGTTTPSTPEKRAAQRLAADMRQAEDDGRVVSPEESAEAAHAADALALCDPQRLNLYAAANNRSDIQDDLRKVCRACWCDSIWRDTELPIDEGICPHGMTWTEFNGEAVCCPPGFEVDNDDDCIKKGFEVCRGEC